MNPPDAAAVFAVDEKPQIQALNRTAPTRPMPPTTPQRATHNYERNGTVDLFAALSIAQGTVISDIRTSHNQNASPLPFSAYTVRSLRPLPRTVSAPSVGVIVGQVEGNELGASYPGTEEDGHECGVADVAGPSGGAGVEQCPQFAAADGPAFGQGLAFDGFEVGGPGVRPAPRDSRLALGLGPATAQPSVPTTDPHRPQRIHQPR